MMSRISGNPTTNTEHQNVLGVGTSMAFVNAYNTDSSTAQLNKQQRKKRKKKKDSHKLLFTQTTEPLLLPSSPPSLPPPPTICNCDKRIESQPFSTCLNCAPNACVLCRLNETTSRCDGNFYAQTEAHFDCDFPQTEKQHKSINCWTTTTTTTTGENESDLAADGQRCWLRRNQLNRHIEQLHRFAIYENLCEFCGFAIGNGVQHLNCDLRKRANELWNNNNNNQIELKNHTENIYENICDICHSLFDGENCTNVQCAESKTATVEVIDILVKKPPITNRQFGKQFSEFLGSFKQRLTPKTSECERRRPKIEIVHNIDDPFKTNQTFDLNEIVQLKKIAQRNNHNGKRINEYGKLRNRSDETVNKSNNSLIQETTQSSPFVHPFRAATSDSNFLANYHLTSSHLHAPYSESIVSDTVLYSNSYAPPSYEDAIQDKYACVNPFNLYEVHPLHESTSASSFFTYNSSLQSLEPTRPAIATLLNNDESLRHWVTSLKQQTYDYAEDNRQFECDSIKCIPPKMFAKQTDVTDAAVSQETNLRCRVDAFKSNLQRRRAHSKRNAIYIDNTSSIEEYAQNTETTSQTLVENINHDAVLEATTRYFQMLKAVYMTQIALSTGLCRITLVCGDRRTHFLVKILLNQPFCEFSALEHANELVRPTEYFCFERIIEIIHKMNITKQLSERKRSMAPEVAGKQSKLLSFENCVSQSTNFLLEIPLNTRSIDEFTKNNNNQSSVPSIECIENITKTLNDFNKPIAKNSAKTMNDFAVKSHYSSHANDDETERPKQRNKENQRNDAGEENIYQPIWMFKTIGGATTADTSHDMDSLNSFIIGECSDDDLNIKLNDGSEWEGAEGEFLFSSNRISTINNLLNSTPVISHNGTTSKLLKCSPNNKKFYKTVCILYNSVEPKLNKIIYDYNANTVMAVDGVNETVAQQNMCRNNDCIQQNKTITNRNRSNELNIDRGQVFKPISKNNIKVDSINAWKSMLRTVDYIDDEEDVILTENSFKTIECNKQPKPPTSVIDDSSSSTTENDSIQSNKTKKSFISSNLSMNSSTSSTLSSVSSSTSSSSNVNDSKTSRKESSLFNKLQHRRFDINKNSKKDETTIQGLLYKNLNESKSHEWKEITESSPPMEIKRLNQSQNGAIVFGATLDEVEKDDEYGFIPKFVVECIRIIELEENMQTNGIYRASGRKDSIDKLRKRMNDSKLRKGTKYVTLKDEDIHTITGALKQFFRELKTDLIPDELVRHLPNDLESETSLVYIRHQVSTIEYLPRETLKYLLKHLRRVDASSEFNLMNASNLSIVWGASLFSSSVNILNAFETSDLMRKNQLVRILIQRYDEIFIDIDRLI